MVNLFLINIIAYIYDLYNPARNSVLHNKSISRKRLSLAGQNRRLFLAGRNRNRVFSSNLAFAGLRPIAVVRIILMQLCCLEL